jgi:hypothetical protein
MRLPVVRRLALAAGVAGFVAIVPYWGSSAWAKAPAPQTHHVHHHSTKVGPLSGKWSGNYSGSYSGTFSLTWQQSGNKLDGTIEISAFSDAPTALTGTVQGKSIKFGTVGSEAISYSGSFSASNMSGSWKMQAEGRSMGGGSWQAARSS